jgi:hypothetical protein
MEDAADHAATGCYAATYALCAVILLILIIRLPKKNAVSHAKDFHLSALSIILAQSFAKMSAVHARHW